MSIHVPPPLGLGRPSRQSIQYRLEVVQHPIRARCCGFGEKDKRPIDPPPILQLCVAKPDGSLERVSTADNISHFIVQCDLFSVDQKSIRNVVYHPASINPAYPNNTAMVMSFQEPTPMRNLMGTVVSSAHQLVGLDNQLGIYFVFGDLSVRTEGRFVLRFRFIDLSAGEPLTMSTRILNEAFSDPFTVYSAKNFPGMTGSTALSQCFARQGIKISVRKGQGIKRTSDEIYRAPREGITRTDASSSSSNNNNDHEGVEGRKGGSGQGIKETEPTAIAPVVAAPTPAPAPAPAPARAPAPAATAGSGGGPSAGGEAYACPERTTSAASSSMTVSAPTTISNKMHISSVLASDDEDMPEATSSLASRRRIRDHSYPP